MNIDSNKSVCLNGIVSVFIYNLLCTANFLCNFNFISDFFFLDNFELQDINIKCEKSKQQYSTNVIMKASYFL